MITGISEFWFFGPKMAVSWHTSAFQKKGPETPIFIVFLGCALFGPSCQKREILDTHLKQKKILTDNWKALFFGIFVFFFLCLSLFVFFVFWVFFLVFFGLFWEGLRSGEVALRATSLGPKPSLFVFLFVLFCFFVFVCSFPFFVFNRKTLFPPKKRAFLFFFSVFLFLSP